MRKADRVASKYAQDADAVERVVEVLGLGALCDEAELAHGLVEERVEVRGALGPKPPHVRRRYQLENLLRARLELPQLVPAEADATSDLLGFGP